MTSCLHLKIIEVPILYENGKSVFPNQVNLLELNPIEGRPAAIVARSYFGPFDQELVNILNKRGVQVQFVKERQNRQITKYFPKQLGIDEHFVRRQFGVPQFMKVFTDLKNKLYESVSTEKLKKT